MTFKGKNGNREPELIDVEQYIGKKGFRAKGKKVSWLDIKEVKFVEPLVKEEPEEEPVPDEDLPEETPAITQTDDAPAIDLTDWSNPEEPTLF